MPDFTTWPFALGSGATAPRTTPDRFDDIVNVKDFGAKGDGSTDDTAACQAAIEAAFGPPDAPHGQNNRILNRPLFFPGGNYKINAPATLTVSGAVNNGGLIKLTVSTIPNYGTSAQAYKTGYLCFVTGVGGITDNGAAVNRNYGITVDDATHITLRNTVFGGSFTSGGTVKRSALQFVAIDGGRIYGAGRGATKIEPVSNTSSLCAFNGFARSSLSGIEFTGAAGPGICLDLDWDYSVTPGCQSNTFYDLALFDCAYGARVGNHGQQASELTFIDCMFNNCVTAGISIQNYNALQVQVFGGNIGGCNRGIEVIAGSAPVIMGVGFQNGSGTDIVVERTAGDAYFIAACRTESTNFAHFQEGVGAHISGCVQIASAEGHFLFYETGGVNTCMLDGCFSQNGKINPVSNGRIWIRGGTFLNSNFITSMGALGKIMQWDKGPITVSALPPSGPHLQGLRQLVTDSNATLATGHGNTVVGGGSNIVPVYCDGTATTGWRIG